MLAGARYTGGEPDDGLVSFAAKADARLVIVASSGTGALGRWMLGSVAERTAESSPVPTLVVRASEPFVAWARGERALKIFVATDFTETSDAALRWVAEFRQIGPCEITLGYIDRRPEERGELAIYDAMKLVAERPETRQALESDLRAKAERLLRAEVAIRAEPGSARVDAHLIALAADAGADLLVLGTHQWHSLDRVWHASISRRVLHDAPMSVACVPVPAAPRGSAAPHPGAKAGARGDGFFRARWRGDSLRLFRAAARGRGLSAACRQPRRRRAQGRAGGATPRADSHRSRLARPGDRSARRREQRFRERDLRSGGSLRRGPHLRRLAWPLGVAVMGSVAQAVIARSARPVLVVHPRC